MDPVSNSRRGQVSVPDALYKAVRAVAHLICALYWRVSVDAARPVPEQGPVILAPVHRSFMDFFVVSEATKRKIFYMAKDELWHNRLLGRFLDAVGAFPVNRSGTDRAALDTARTVLERGDVLIVFPEGTRRSGPQIEGLHEGAAFLAARTGAVIVPIGIGGTEAAMPKGSKMIRPVKVHLVVGEPIDPPEAASSGRVPRSKIHATTETLRVALQRLFDEAQQAVGA